MPEKPSDENRLRARRTPNSSYPPSPPSIASSIDSVYYALSQESVDRALQNAGDRLVTSQIVYQHGLLAFARVIFEGTRWAIYHEREVLKVLEFPGIDWEEPVMEKWDNARMRTAPEGVCFYNYDPAFNFTQETLDLLQEEYVSYLMSHEVLELYYHPVLRIYRKLDESDEHFYDRCLEQLRKNHEQELRKLEETIQWQQERLKEKLDRLIREHGPDAMTMLPSEEAANGADPPPASGSLMPPESVDSLYQVRESRAELAKLQMLKSQKLKEVDEGLVLLSRQQEKDLIRVNRGQIRILRFAFVWLPYTELVLQDESGDRRMELVRSF
jgi:hypothetical protein